MDFYIWCTTLTFQTSFCETKIRLPEVGPWGNFAEFVEWVLVNCKSPFTISPTEEDVTSPAPDPELSQPSILPSPPQTLSPSPLRRKRQSSRLSDTLPRSPSPTDSLTRCMSHCPFLWGCLWSSRSWRAVLKTPPPVWMSCA